MARAGGKDRGVQEIPKGSGVWYARWHDELGREHKWKVGSKSAAKALYKKKKEEARLRALGLINTERVEEQQRMTVDKLLERYQPQFERKRSWSDDKRYLGYWSSELGSLLVHEVRPGDIEAYRCRRLQAGLSPATINRCVAFLKRVFNLAIRDEIVLTNPVSKLSMLQENNKKVRFLLDHEEAALRGVMVPHEFEIVEVGFLTGLRRAELFGLEKSHVDLETELATIPRSKHGESRQVPLTDRATEILRARFERSELPFLFPNVTDTGPLDANNWVGRRFKPALREAGIENFRFHDLRHTYCSRLVMEGISLLTVQELAGHKSYETTRRYAHLSPEHTRAAVKVLDRRQPRPGRGHLAVAK